MPPPLLYNLFPRLVGRLGQWKPHAERARALGFNWIYLNPVTQPGFSGSLYAVKDHYRVAGDFLPERSSFLGKDGMRELREVIETFSALGLKVALDLVINHTSFDCPLAKTHPEWFGRDEKGEPVHPSAIDPADARKVTVWGDLIEVDNARSSDREGLWSYWKTLVRFYAELGFSGFRCDAAYKVPAELWRVLVEEARQVDPRATFFAETLGCRLAETAALQPAGMDYLFNSSKYWLFDQPWALDQHESFGALAPSISFAESHDTPRLMAETKGNLAVQRQRYLFATLFSEGALMPIGYEFGFRKRLDVVKTTPNDWEETGVDLSPFIRAVNAEKTNIPLLGQEGHWRVLRSYDQPTIALEKTGADDACMLVLINKNWHESQKEDLGGLPIPSAARLRRIGPLGQRRESAVPAALELEPAEIALVY